MTHVLDTEEMSFDEEYLHEKHFLFLKRGTENSCMINKA